VLFAATWVVATVMAADTVRLSNSCTPQSASGVVRFTPVGPLYSAGAAVGGVGDVMAPGSLIGSGGKRTRGVGGGERRRAARRLAGLTGHGVAVEGDRAGVARVVQLRIGLTRAGVHLVVRRRHVEHVADDGPGDDVEQEVADRRAHDAQQAQEDAV